jgi:hypothetical protein
VLSQVQVVSRFPVWRGQLQAGVIAAEGCLPKKAGRRYKVKCISHVASGFALLRIFRQHANLNIRHHPQGARLMPAFDEHKDELEHYETMMGPHRGRLAVALDLLTNALILVGQHGVYCHTNRDPDVPVMDIRIIQAEIGKAKELIQSVMEAMRAERDKKS